MGDLDAAGFENRPQRRGGDAFAQRGHDTTRNENVFGGKDRLLESRMIRRSIQRQKPTLKHRFVVNYLANRTAFRHRCATDRPLREAGHPVSGNPGPGSHSFRGRIVDFVDATAGMRNGLTAAPTAERCSPTPTSIWSSQLPGRGSCPRPADHGLSAERGRQAPIRGKPVVTLVACRNMWLSAQETMQS